VVGLSDHSLSINPCIGATALGASILERHFTSDMSWDGPDIPVSMDPAELRLLLKGVDEVHKSLGGEKSVLAEEAETIAFAYASVVTTRHIFAGEPLTEENIWCKRPGTGDFLAADYEKLLGTVVVRDIPADTQVSKTHVGL